MNELENIYNGEQFLGFILHSGYHDSGIKFLTNEDSPQQIGYMNRPSGYVIPPHVHNKVLRSVEITQEVLIVLKGRVRIDYYDEKINYLESRFAGKGDIIFLGYGGHGFKILEDSEIVEVKQGPYCGEMDKIRFNPIDDNNVIIKEK